MARIDVVLDHLTQVLTVHAPVLATAMLPGLPQADIRRQVQGLPFRLPRELTRLYQWRNGMNPEAEGGTELLPGAWWPSLEGALKLHAMATQSALVVAEEAGLEASSLWDPQWFPFLHGIGGDYYVVRGATRASATSPVYVVSNVERQASLAYDSVTRCLMTVAQCYASGAYTLDEDGVVIEDPQQVAALTRAQNPKRTKWLLVSGEDTPTLEGLMARLKDPDEEKAWKAAEALIALKDPSTVEPLIKAMQDETTRYFAIRVLEELGDQRAVDPLIQVLDDPYELVRSAAVGALGSLGDRKAIGPLLRLLQEDPKPYVRIPAASALGQLRASDAVEPLLRATQSADATMRRAALAALGEIGDPRAFAPLLEALDHPSSYIHDIALSALGDLGDPQGIAPVTRFLDHEDLTTREIARQVLARLQAQGK